MSQIITIPFTTPFIDSLAHYIDTHYVQTGKDLSRLAIVFGGRRPAMFLRRALVRAIGKPFIPPAMLTIDEWMTALASQDNERRSLSDLDHGYIIYQIVHSIAPHLLKGRERFAQFLPWAREIIGFIEQVDLEGLEESALNNLAIHADIGFDVPHEINELLKDLSLIRRSYHEYLIKHRIAVRGLDYLHAQQHIEQFPLKQFDTVIFANFFYVHRTEMSVLKELSRRGQLLLFMQGDERRWPALKRIGQQFNTAIVEGEAVAPTRFDLHVHAAVDMHTQAGIIAQLIKDSQIRDETVIVLPNPDFILPLLSAIGSNLNEFNISLGYPLKRSSLFALLELMVLLQNSVKNGQVYSRDYLRLWHHPLIKNLSLKENSLEIRVLTQACEDVLTGNVLSPISGNLFITLATIENDEVLLAHAKDLLLLNGIERSTVELTATLHHLHEVFINQWLGVSSFNELSACLESFILMMTHNQSLQHYPFNQAVIKLLEDLQRRYQTLFFANENFERDELFRVFLDSLSREVVGFTGSPLRGLQILGLFETRALNFKHVIVADMNEGVLPNLNIYEPLIPREVMIKLNLDRLELEEEIQRYGFMRLIACAKRVDLVYQQKTQGVRSRFLEELIWEQEQRQGKIGVVKEQAALFGSSVSLHQTEAVKTPAMIDFLKNFTYSASSLNTYLRNPYEFYLNYVLGLREQEDLLDDPDSRQVGTFIHLVLEEAFKVFLKKKPVIDEVFYRRLMDIFEAHFKHYFGQSGRADAFMLKQIMRTRLERFLALEAERCYQVKEILYLEKKFTDSISLPNGSIKLTYRVDRVDLYEDGTVIVIDYKTGSGDVMPRGFDTFEAMQSFQMPLYIDYLSRLYPHTPVNAALYQLRTTEFERFINSKRSWPIEQIVQESRVLLDAMMEEIWDIHTPFIYRPQGKL